MTDVNSSADAGSRGDAAVPGDDAPPSLFDEIRQACATVAERAAAVSIDPDALDELAATLTPDDPPLLPEERPTGDDEAMATEVLVWNAVNFGSGWFPLLAKRDGLSGARTLAEALADHVAASGTPTAGWLAAADAATCAQVFGQPHPGPVDGLLELFAAAWRDLGALLADRFDGSAAALVRSAGGSAADLVTTLGSMPLAHDVAHYGTGRDEISVPFYKRAQISVSHLSRAFDGDGLGRFDDGDRLTAFADNLVPHVLRMAGVLVYDDDLAGRIDREELLTAGSPEEVEIRACGLHAVELLAASTARGRPRSTTSSGSGARIRRSRPSPATAAAARGTDRRRLASAAMANRAGRLVEIAVGDDPADWTSIGFTVDDHGVCRVGAVGVRLVGARTERGRGIVGWTLVDRGPADPDRQDGGVHDLDGLPTVLAGAHDVDAPTRDLPPAHPNGVTRIDHLVVITPDLDRTTAAIEALGIEARRTREAGRGRRQRFFRLGEVILELVGPVEPSGAGPATFWGLAFTVADIDATTGHLVGRTGEPRTAVQPGRRIATLRPGDDLSVPIAFMSSADAVPPGGDAGHRL